MKSKISFSLYATIVTFVVYVALFVGCIVCVNDKTAFYILLALYIVLIVLSLLFGASYIKADSKNIVMGSILRSAKIPMRDVESVELFQPTMGEIRLFASGGFMGYWGIFREGDVGNYYGFYGKSSDCFLVRMKNGDKYVLGCDEPGKMVNYIKEQIGK